MADTRSRGFRRAALALALLPILACGTPPVNVPHDPGSTDVLFIGNSLTASNDLPRLVARVAAADGRRLEVAAVTAPATSLEDHWRAGAPTTVRRVRAEVVVLQQGPSSLPENAAHLASWSARFAGVIRDTGGRPALLMVWPPRARWNDLTAVEAAYRDAARGIDGLLIPAGEVWGEALRRDPDLPMTGPDGFHPARLGSLAAALTVYGVVAGVDPAALPCPPLAGTSVERALVCEVVRETLARRRSSGSSGGRVRAVGGPPPAPTSRARP